MKATHSGHCQICGSQQKLPSGNLSKHGYTVRWGFFSGTCNGAGHPPFEQSKDLIEGAIAKTQNMVADWKTKINALTGNGNPATVWVYEHRRLGNGHVDKEWREMPRADVKLGYFTEWTQKDGKKGKTNIYIPLTCTLDDYALELNKRYAKVFQGHVSQAEQYIQWQRERIADWKPAPLIPVEAENDEAAAPAKARGSKP